MVLLLFAGVEAELFFGYAFDVDVGRVGKCGLEPSPQRAANVGVVVRHLGLLFLAVDVVGGVEAVDHVAPRVVVGWLLLRCVL